MYMFSKVDVNTYRIERSVLSGFCAMRNNKENKCADKKL